MYMGLNLRRMKLASPRSENPRYQNIYLNKVMIHWLRQSICTIALGSREIFRSQKLSWPENTIEIQKPNFVGLI